MQAEKIKNMDPQAKTNCPMCRLNQLRRHCDDTGANCAWMTCRNKHCQASFDPAHNRGHALDPNQPLLTRRVVRLVFENNTWKVDPCDV